jgi:alpha-glucoside transport system permease protein
VTTRPPRRGAGLRRAPLHAVVVGICLLWLLPVAGLLVSAFRPARLVAATGWWTAFVPPVQFTLDNVIGVLTIHHVGRSFANSLAISVPATVLPILVAACAAYAFAWMTFPGRDALFAAVVAALVIPLQMTLIPVLRLLGGMGLAGTFPAAWLAHTAYGLPFAIFLLRAAFVAIPADLLESARLDGAGAVTAFFRIVVPLAAPTVASLAIFQFLWVWNDLLVALVVVGGTPAVAPLTVALSNLVNSLGGNWQALTAAALVSLLLPLAVFFALQPYFVRGILAGALKG